MKKSIKPVVLAGVCLIAGVLAGCAETSKDTVIREGIRFCESTYPYQGGILIANFGSEQLNPLNSEGKGYILHYKDGKVNPFIAADGSLSAPKGMFEKNGYLYVCDVNKLVVYDLKALDKAPRIISFPEDDLFLNDLAADGDDLYISVTNSDRIYRLDIGDPAALDGAALVKWLDIAGPNGIVIDRGTMYVASYPADGNTTAANVIYKVADLQNPVAEPFYNVPGQYDGIALSADKATLYVSNWAPAEVTSITLGNGKTSTLQPDDQLAGPADMTLSDGVLYIPDLPNSRMLIYEL